MLLLIVPENCWRKFKYFSRIVFGSVECCTADHVLTKGAQQHEIKEGKQSVLVTRNKPKMLKYK